MDLDYEMMMLGIVNEIRKRAPVVSGNLKSSIKMVGYKEGSIFGKIEIGGDTGTGKKVEYAQFVNYGYLVHSNSKKLQRDYLFVENGIKKQLRILVGKYGGGHVK